MKIIQVLILLIQQIEKKFNILSLIFLQMIPMPNHELGKFMDNDDPCDASSIGWFDWWFSYDVLMFRGINTIFEA